ncbi:hypothetical protein AVEN_72878-1 [Araneus ventricosus]|uniref:Uncharacterized protein n=1 Tax=Araneus ventricosus TaxID=182803 RepID=A0A4Y2T1T6_ARAVE|nr:hypothetical protein AVEN_72878-1 [Araneus ventricosus]
MKTLINCHNARKVGITSMNKMFGRIFNYIKLKCVDKVLLLLTISSAIKVHDEKVPIDPVLLFQRMSITKSFEDELETFFRYGLVPYPLSLFDAIGMRKTQKSAIYDCFQCVNVEIHNTNTTYIVDGGYLLHRVVWVREEIFDAIFVKYVHYVHGNFVHNVIIVFDGYSDYTKNIKVAEQRRRTTKISSSFDVLFDRFMTVPTNQQQFLANTHNKFRFISMLSEKLKAADIFCETS